MENDKLSENEILDILKNKLVKGSSVNTLCEELSITDYDLFGYVKQLKDENINIINQEIVNKANTFLAKKGSSIAYNYSISGEVISLAIQYIELDKFDRPIVSFDTYNINVLDKHVLTDEEILSKLSVSEEEIYNIVSSKFRDFYKDEVDKKVLDGECDYECFLYMRGIEDDNYTKDRKLYINSGNLYVLKAFDIYSPFSEENYFTFNDYLFQITE